MGTVKVNKGHVGAMGDDCVVHRYRKADRERVFAFLRSAHSGGAGDRLIRQWDWKFDANPFNREAEQHRRADCKRMLPFLRANRSPEELQSWFYQWGVTFEEDTVDRGDDPYVLLLQYGAEIIGMIAAQPLRFRIAGHEQWVANLGDWIMHPAHRERRLAPRLTRRLASENPLLMSWENEFSQKRGAPPGPDIAKSPLAPLVKPLDWHDAVHQVSGSRLFGRAAGLAAASARRVQSRLRAPAATRGVTVTAVKIFDDDINRLWQRACGDYPLLVVRNRRYLNWRFVSRPDAGYTLLLATRDTEPVGYMVLRVADRDGAPRGYLVDFLVAERSASIFAVLLRHAEDHLRGQGVPIFSCRIAPTAYQRILRRHGFHPVAFGQRGAIRVERNLPDAFLRIYTDLSQWYVTMGDGDMEMSI